MEELELELGLFGFNKRWLYKELCNKVYMYICIGIMVYMYCISELLLCFKMFDLNKRIKFWMIENFFFFIRCLCRRC